MDISSWKIKSGLTASKRDMFQASGNVACCKKPKAILLDDCGRSSQWVLTILHSVLIAAAPLVLLAYFIYFLSVDRDKGGECADTSCRAVWVYTIVKLCSYVALPCLLLAPCKCENQFLRQLPYLSAFSLHIGMFVYGGIVLIRDDPCAQCKNTGIFQISYVWWIIEVAVCSLAPCMLGWILYSWDDD